MTDKTIFKLQANTCKALSHPVRLEIIELLLDDELSFGDIMKRTGLLKSNLSQHLSVLKNKGLVVVRRDGQNSYFKLSSAKVADACGLMRRVIIENLKKQNEILKKLP